MNKTYFTICLYFEIKNAEAFGGEGSIGYTDAEADFEQVAKKKFDIQQFAAGNIKYIAKLLEVSETDVKNYD